MFKQISSEIKNIMYLLRFPSVTTCVQSSYNEVNGHFHNAPDWFVPGCKF